MLDNFLWEHAEQYFHVLIINHGGVVVEIVNIHAHEQRQDGGDDTVEEDLGCDQACALRGNGPVV